MPLRSTDVGPYKSHANATTLRRSDEKPCTSDIFIFAEMTSSQVKTHMKYSCKGSRMACLIIIAILIKIITIFSRDLLSFITSQNFEVVCCFAVFKKTIILSLLSYILYR